MILIYIHVTGEHFILGPIDKTKIISSRISYQTTLLLGKPNAVDVKGMRYFVLFLTFKSTISIMIKFILNLLSKPPWCSGYFTCLINQRSQV